MNERIHALADQAFTIMLDALAGKDVKPLQLRAALALLKMIRADGATRESAADLSDCWLDHRANPEPQPQPEPERPANAHPRNLPCPCGSGIKYKRCCGSPMATASSAAA